MEYGELVGRRCPGLGCCMVSGYAVEGDSPLRLGAGATSSIRCGFYLSLHPEF